jgi:aspartyl-tRNA(Asn)/glutamyl-tRNA(Gln) amidotransferase subunit C
MSISEGEVRGVARLARLEIAEEAVGPMALELSKILNYVAQLNELDTSEVPPTRQVGTLSAPFRDDTPVDARVGSHALLQAPRASDSGFLVPGFVDEG